MHLNRYFALTVIYHGDSMTAIAIILGYDGYAHAWVDGELLGDNLGRACFPNAI